MMLTFKRLFSMANVFIGGILEYKKKYKAYTKNKFNKFQIKITNPSELKFNRKTVLKTENEKKTDNIRKWFEY